MHGRAKLMVVAVLAVSAMGGFAPAAHAESRAKQSAEAHYEKGMKAYTLGHFPDAIEEFEKAYELRSEPIFLYNIAQSHRQNNSPQRAIFFYRRYLEAEPTAKNRAEIEKRIGDLETQLNEQKEHTAAPMTPAPAQTTVAPAVPSGPPAAAVAPAPLAVAPQPLPQPAPQPAAGDHPGRALRIAGITTASVGVVGIGLGIGFGLHANTLHDEAYSPRWDASKYDSSKTYRTLEWVSLGIGGAALLTGGVLYYLGWSAGSDAPVAFAPVVAPGMAGAALFGGF